MANTVKQEEATNTVTTSISTAGTSGTDTRYFTQDDVDSIVQERLARERAKYEGFEDLKEKAAKFDEMEEKNKSDLQKATEKADALQKQIDEMKKADSIRLIRETVAKSTGVPVSLLTKDTEEECEAQAKEIMAFAKPNGYPQVQDGGETNYTGKKTTREQFAEWFKAQTQ